MIELTAEGLRRVFPRAPQDVLDSFLEKQEELSKIGVNHTRTRLAYFLANIEHETDGFTIRNLTENINYTHQRAAEIWPSRFKSAVDVETRFGSAPGWQTALFDSVYGSRMGNRPGTHDGSMFIGRGGPQWTGREGYEELARRTNLPAVEHPSIAARHDLQPEVCVSFWDWKKLNPLADVDDFKGMVRRWNGGQIGIEDRRARLAGNDRAVDELPDVDVVRSVARTLPGSPPTAAPPKHVIDATTEKERKARAVGTATGAAGGAGEVAKQGTQQPDEPTPALLSPVVTWALIGVGVGMFLVAAILIARKTAAVKKNWF